MGQLLGKAKEEASKLPESEQEEVGAWLLADEDERRWNELFSRRGAAIESLADQALLDDAAGRTTPFDPDRR